MANKFDLEDFHENDVILIESEIVKLGKFREEVRESFRDSDLEDRLKDGIDAEVLRIGSNGWKKWKVKVRCSLEFYPDEPEVEDAPTSNQPESFLDDIRQTMKQNSQQYSWWEETVST